MTFRISVFTLFPGIINAVTRQGLLAKAMIGGHLEVQACDLRAYATDAYRTVDDAPYGGGPGMVLKPEPVFAAVRLNDPPRPLLLLDAGGKRFDQAWAAELAAGAGCSLLCGRYEGVDHRIRSLVDAELSIGDFVLGGGEAAAIVVIDAVARLVPGVMGNDASALEESFSSGLLEYPQFTRPAVFEGMAVPEVLRSGDHERVRQWRHAQALHRTLRVRPDLIEARGGLRDDERTLLETFPPID